MCGTVDVDGADEPAGIGGVLDLVTARAKQLDPAPGEEDLHLFLERVESMPFEVRENGEQTLEGRHHSAADL
jgi:hypothetical protein